MAPVRCDDPPHRKPAAVGSAPVERRQHGASGMPLVPTVRGLVGEVAYIPDDDVLTVDGLAVHVRRQAVARGAALTSVEVLGTLVVQRPQVAAGEGVGEAVVRAGIQVIAGAGPLVEDRPTPVG